MKELPGTYFSTPKAGTYCFGIAVINWLRLHDLPEDEEKLLQRYCSSPYTEQGGGTNLLVATLQIKYMTERGYQARLYHCHENAHGKNLEHFLMDFPKDTRKTIAQEVLQEIEKGNVICSMEEMRRFFYLPIQKRGVICSLTSNQVPLPDIVIAHTVVWQNPYRYPPRSFIDATGKVLQAEPHEETRILGIIDIDTK